MKLWFLCNQLPLSCCWRLCYNYGISVIRNLTGQRKTDVSVDISSLIELVQFSHAERFILNNFHLFLDVLNQKRGGTQIIHWKAEEALDLLLMQVHGDDVC